MTEQLKTVCGSEDLYSSFHPIPVLPLAKKNCYNSYFNYICVIFYIKGNTMAVTRFGVSLEEELLEQLDELVIKNQFPNRSRAISFLIEKNLIEEKWEDNREVAGAIVLVYDHH
jgi:hypothetical protein